MDFSGLCLDYMLIPRETSAVRSLEKHGGSTLGSHQNEDSKCCGPSADVIGHLKAVK